MSEFDSIIKSYKPKKGFYDLSIKPKTLNKREYAKILKNQMFLHYVEENKDYYISNDENSWKIAKEISAMLQHIIFEHWKEYPYGDL